MINDEWVTLIANIGFPVVVAMFVLIRLEKAMVRVEEAILKMTEAVIRMEELHRK